MIKFYVIRGAEQYLHVKLNQLNKNDHNYLVVCMKSQTVKIFAYFNCIILLFY